MALSSTIRNGFRRFMKDSSRTSLILFQHRCPVSRQNLNVHSSTPESGSTTAVTDYNSYTSSATDFNPFHLSSTTNFDPLFYTGRILNAAAGNCQEPIPYSTTQQIEMIKADIRSTKNLILTLFQDHGYYHDDYDLCARESLRSTNILCSELFGYKETMKLNGETKHIITKDDWLSVNLHFCPFILYYVKMMVLGAYRAYRKEEKLRGRTKSFESERAQVFQEYMEYLVKEADCNFHDAFYYAFIKHDTLAYAPPEDECCVSRLSTATRYLGLLMHFELVFEGIARSDSLEEMKKWVKRKVEDGHLRCPLPPSYQANVEELTYLLNGLKPLREQFPFIEGMDVEVTGRLSLPKTFF